MKKIPVILLLCGLIASSLAYYSHIKMDEFLEGKSLPYMSGPLEMDGEGMVMLEGPKEPAFKIGAEEQTLKFVKIPISQKIVKTPISQYSLFSFSGESFENFLDFNGHCEEEEIIFINLDFEDNKQQICMNINTGELTIWHLNPHTP